MALFGGVQPNWLRVASLRPIMEAAARQFVSSAQNHSRDLVCPTAVDFGDCIRYSSPMAVDIDLPTDFD